jgi:hypothetical protein
MAATKRAAALKRRDVADVAWMRDAGGKLVMGVKCRGIEA